jgi:hypothetical protein
MLKSVTGLKILQLYIKDELKKKFSDEVKNGKQSEIIRGMMMLYLTKPQFRTEVDKFVEVTKTI